MTLRRLFLGGSWLVGWVAVSGHAHASQTFPPLLQANLELAQLPYAPMGCQLCHQDDNGGAMTATKPFGRAMLKAGTVGGNPPSMLAALRALEADGTDSDGDGDPDIAELRAGEDPNVPAAGAMVSIKQVPLPETGCSVSRPNGGAGVWSLAVVLAFAWRRRARRGQLAALTRPT